MTKDPPTAGTPPIRSITAILDRIETAATAPDISLGDVVEALGRASFLPVMVAPALAVVSPLSAIPFFPTLCGITIALIALQLLLRRRYLWLPRWITRRQLNSDRLKAAVAWLKRPAAFLDRHARPRLLLLVRAPLVWIAQATCMACGLAMPFLELLPLTSSILGGAITLLALGMLAQDGLIAAIGFGWVACAVYVGWILVT